MLLAFVAYGLVTKTAGYVGWKSIVTLFVLCTAAEMIAFEDFVQEKAL